MCFPARSDLLCTGPMVVYLACEGKAAPRLTVMSECADRHRHSGARESASPESMAPQERWERWIPGSPRGAPRNDEPRVTSTTRDYWHFLPATSL